MIRLCYIIFFILVSALSFCNYVETTTNDCFDVKNYAKRYLASKTPYRYIANYNDEKISFDGCVPKKIWAVVRHGTRYPDEKLINRMKTRLIEIQTSIRDKTYKKEPTLCEQNLYNITEWKPEIEVPDSKKLSHEGEEEMIELGERFQNRFPDIVKSEYANTSFLFKSTDTERTIQSLRYFTIGLFGKKVANHIWTPAPEKKDPILRFYKLCTKWLKKVKHNPKSQSEVNKFRTSDNAEKVLKNVAIRLGYENLSFEDVELMYMTCSYESSWNRYAFSPWCSVFSEEDMQVMEYLRDLKYYWTDGYGYDINFQQACPMLEDFLKFAQSEDGPSSSFYFTHSGTLLKLLSHLGLYYDEFKLTSDKFKQPRLWKVSHIDAFGSNLAFVTFQCGDQLKLLTLHQERPVKLPGCPKDGLCFFTKVMKVYKNSFTNCQFSEMCKM